MAGKKRVLILNHAMGYTEMFRKHGWEITDHIRDADLVQFTGGSDVSPEMYGETRHPKTHCNPLRDQAEQQIFTLARNAGVPIAGICRGGQFVNIMCGGRLFQDVNNHAISGVHAAIDNSTGEVFNVTSTHHQMIRPTQDAKIVVTANECTERAHMNPKRTEPLVTYGKVDDIEACYYEEYNAFCFQPHPEFHGHIELANRYFAYLETELGLQT